MIKSNKGLHENKLDKITEDFWVRFKALISDSIRCILELRSNEESRQKDQSVWLSYFCASPKQHWQNVGKGYDVFWKSTAKKRLSVQEIQFINHFLHKTKGEYILDIGVGTGRLIENYIKEPTVKKVDGIDISDNMVNFCIAKFNKEKKVGTITTCDISSQNIPFLKKYDFISAVRVFKYNKNWKEIIGKLLPRLNNEGIILFSMPNKNSLARFTPPEVSIYYTTKSEIKKTLKEHKFQLEELTGFMKFPDVFYDLANNKIISNLLFGLERILRIILGTLFLTRIYFIVAKKYKNAERLP